MADGNTLDQLLDRWENSLASGRELSPADLCEGSSNLLPVVVDRIAALREMAWLEEDDEPADYLSLPPAVSNSSSFIALPADIEIAAFASRLVESRVLEKDKIQQFSAKSASVLAAKLIEAGHLTKYQARQVAAGAVKGLVLGNYVILDKIGAGGMGQVFPSSPSPDGSRGCVEDFAQAPQRVARSHRAFPSRSSSGRALESPQHRNRLRC